MFAAMHMARDGMELEEMSTKIGHFEILSELAKSPTGSVYKANDPESGQTVALKAIQLSAFGDASTALEQALLAEVERTKVLSSPNITPVYGAGEIEGKFCAAMEYVQGNSIATMLARKEGFSIWDLLDIGRQLGSCLDHTASNNIVHYSLEPAKIMCGWDGTVKILGFGLSSVGNFAHLVTEGMPTVLHYMSPEQVQGEPMDDRSNLFSLGAIFYEMVTERKAFDHDDIESLRQSILESTPVPPIQVNQKVHPLLSDLIMKALSKNPADRYHCGRELLEHLEKCKESRPAVPVAKKPQPVNGPAISESAKAAAQSKFVTSASGRPAPTAPAPVVPRRPTPAPAPSGSSGLAAPASRPAEGRSGLAAPTKAPESKPSGLARPASKLAAPKAAVAAAGVESIPPPASQEIEVSDRFIAAGVKPTIDTAPQMSSALAGSPEIETFEAQADNVPKIAVDPMMAEDAPSGTGGTSFSDVSELPPLKDVYAAPPLPPPPVFQPEPEAPARSTIYQGSLKRDEKPKVQPREVAEKAIKEIKNVPPKLMGYALGAAVALILVIAVGVTIYVHTENRDDDVSASRLSHVAEAPAQPEASQAAAKPALLPSTQSEPAPGSAEPVQAAEPEVTPVEPVATPRSRNVKKRAPAAPAIISGQMAVDSTPQGAQVLVDGRTDVTFTTPFALTNLQPGSHSIAVSKAGYSSVTRAVAVTSGNRATVVVHLTQLMATLIVKSDPAGANVYIDGRDSGIRTPGQVSVDKGQHVVLVRKMGYIDETMSTQFVLGQTFNFAPTLRPLGNVDNIRTLGGKMSKLFGGKGAQAGQTVVSIHSQPKGAQVAVNQHILEKSSPVDVAVDPGNYIIDITLTGYAPVHKVINANNGGKIVVDEVLQPQ
jgi:serine/threonine protein kinase